MVKNLPAMQEMQVRSLGREDPLEEEMATHSSVLAGESHGQRGLLGYSPWGRMESDTTISIRTNGCWRRGKGPSVSLTYSFTCSLSRCVLGTSKAPIPAEMLDCKRA